MKVSDFIPKRSPLPKYLQLKEAATEFQEQIKSTVQVLATVYKELFKSDLHGSKDPAKKKKFLFELNQSGKYFALKERLKKSVVRIVKEVVSIFVF